MQKTSQNHYWIKLLIVFFILLLTKITFAYNIKPCKQLKHIDFIDKSLIIETTDGSLFTRHLTNTEYRELMVDFSSHDRLVNDLLDKMECGKNKFKSKEDPNL